MFGKHKHEGQLTAILGEYGFRVTAGKIISGVGGIGRERIWGHCISLIHACQQLVPVIRDAEFAGRLVRYMRATAGVATSTVYRISGRMNRFATTEIVQVVTAADDDTSATTIVD